MVKQRDVTHLQTIIEIILYSSGKCFSPESNDWQIFLVTGENRNQDNYGPLKSEYFIFVKLILLFGN